MDKIREELKACPRCGSKARLITAEKDKRRQTNKIECINKPCIEITRAAMFGISDIIKIWNTRSRDEEIKKLREAIQTIIDLGFDNDGFEEASKLKGLIAELVQIAKSTLDGTFCDMCHGYKWNIIDKETGEAENCPKCNKPSKEKNGEKTFWEWFDKVKNIERSLGHEFKIMIYSDWREFYNKGYTPEEALKE